MLKEGFSAEKYIEEQTKYILERIAAARDAFTLSSEASWSRTNTP